MDKTLLFAGFHSRHDLQFFEKRKYQRFLRSSRQEIGSKSAKNAAIYRGLVPNGTPKVANTLLFTVFRAFHVFLTFQRPCKYQHFLRSTRQKFCNLQCFLLGLPKHWSLQYLCSVLCISGQKSIGIYSIVCVFAFFPQKTLKRKNVVIYSILLVSKG